MLSLSQPRFNFWSGRTLGGFPGGSLVKNLPAKAGGTEDVGSTPGSGRFPEEENAPVVWPGKSHGQRNMMGYTSPCGHKRVVCNLATK